MGHELWVMDHVALLTDCQCQAHEEECSEGPFLPPVF